MQQTEEKGLYITPEAASYVSRLLQAKPTVIGLKVGVKKAGCSGYEYVLEYAYEQKPHDYCFKDQGITMIVDKEIFHKFLKGTTIEYEIKGIQEGITFNNPNVASQCGCGESFNLKDEAV